MEIKLKDGRNFKINSYQKDSFEMIIPFSKVYDTAVLMSKNNVSNAKIIAQEKKQLFINLKR